ncbi:HAMP domain-containing sensor histidine kinase [Hymenobacter saemangeumensis]|uniref:histidine kinase n=1 Tax=Hymenobacter saemangeumensis TaxID=1084522 RepID=A0ABP8INJ1_9BACT
MSIRLRLALQFGAILALTLLLFSLVIYFSTYQARRESFTQSLFTRARVVAHVYVDGLNGASAEREASYRGYLRQFYRTLPEEEASVYDAQNRLVFREGQASHSLAVPRDWLSDVRKTGKDVLERGSNYHQTVGLLYRDPARGDFVVVASSVDADGRDKLNSLQKILIIGLLSSLIVVGIGGWFFAGQALRPVRLMVEEVDGITATDLTKRLSQAEGVDEVSLLAQRFNQLLVRLETAFVGQRTFVRDASHELRTPLAALIGQLEVTLLLPQRSPEEYRRVVQATLDSARRLNDLTNGLLQIARASDDPALLPMALLDLDELLLQAHEEVHRRYPTTWVDLDFVEVGRRTRPRPYRVKGNEALLLAAVLNVLDNACKFTGQQSGKPIVATLTAMETKVRLEVQDQGPGMSAADVEQVYVPFFRAEATRAIPGHGIGLPLTYKIMALHCGSIVVSSTLGKGTTVQLELPMN